MSVHPAASNPSQAPTTGAPRGSQPALPALCFLIALGVALGVSLRAPTSSASTDATAQQTLQNQTPPSAAATPSAAAAPDAAPATTSTPTKAPAPSPKRNGPLDLALFGRLLEQHTQATRDVVGTRVDYRALVRSTALGQLRRQIESARPSQLSRTERLAFWINAYNILTLDLIRKNYPIKSIRDLGSFFSPVWDKTVARVEGREISLGFIEHEILRKMNEPRIHAAIVCASTSCPPLARTPFRADHLDEDLSAAMRSWLASPEKGIQINRAQKRVSLSAIFDWFEEDFETQGGVLKAIAPYVSESQAAWLRKEGRRARIDHFDYDWTLNDLKR